MLDRFVMKACVHKIEQYESCPKYGSLKYEITLYNGIDRTETLYQTSYIKDSIGVATFLTVIIRINVWNSTEKMNRTNMEQRTFQNDR